MICGRRLTPATFPSLGVLALVVGLALPWSAACAKNSAGDPVEVASIAVRANPALELVAADDKQGVLTVRVKRSGQVLVVKAADVTAGTAFSDIDAGSAPAAVSVQSSGQPGVAVSAERESGSGGRLVSVAAGGSQISVSETGGRTPAASVSVSNGSRGVAVDTAGLGVSVGLEKGRAAAAPAPREASKPPSAAVQGGSSGGGAGLADDSLEHRSRPVVCRGQDDMKLDGVLLRVDDVAVVAGGDCDLRISNSHIIGATAIQADLNATIRISNSVIEGPVALQLSGNSTAAVRSTTVRSRVQKRGSADLRDEGGNVWK